MRLIDQGFSVERITERPLGAIEDAGRTCYKSDDKKTQESASKFVRMLVDRGHHAMLEHASMTVRFVTDRGVSHELVRHRIASFAQESTRYVNYAKADCVSFIRPVWYGENEVADSLWEEACRESETAYLELLKLGWAPQQARTVLNNSVKTEIVITANFREWRHVFKLRGIEKAAHPQMRQLILPLYYSMQGAFPEVFDMGQAE